jgi:hypothetical protein
LDWIGLDYPLARQKRLFLNNDFDDYRARDMTDGWLNSLAFHFFFCVIIGGGKIYLRAACGQMT